MRSQIILKSKNLAEHKTPPGLIVNGVQYRVN